MTHATAHSPSAAEPPGAPLLEVPAAVLKVLALTLPPLDTVTDAQARGADCVWCGHGPLLTETAVDLGEHKSHGDLTRFPRGCRKCTGQQAYRALLGHTAPGPAQCQECKDSALGCMIGLILNRLIRQGRQVRR